MPGKLYAAYKACVGQRVRMLFASGERLSNDNLMTYDKKLTGDYVLTTIIHTFSQTEYNVTIDGVKMTRDEL
jgi:acyl-coenzyme A synthetase/AMP-(fatty) acid ligase